MQEQGRQRLLPAFLRGEAAPAAGLWRWRGGACWRAGAPGVCARRGRPQGVHQSSLTPYCSRSARQTVGRGPRRRRRRRLPTSVGNRPLSRRGRQPTTEPLSACPVRRSAAPRVCLPGGTGGNGPAAAREGGLLGPPGRAACTAWRDRQERIVRHAVLPTWTGRRRPRRYRRLPPVLTCDKRVQRPSTQGRTARASARRASHPQGHEPP